MKNNLSEIREQLGLLSKLNAAYSIELERLNMFPDDHTAGPTDGKRAFFMGNALVIRHHAKTLERRFWRRSHLPMNLER